MINAPSPTPEEDWTEEDPIDAEIDARVAQVHQAAGLPPERPARFGPMVTIVLPMIIAGILLIIGIWMFAYPMFFS
ncbi:hypothetical protein WSS15_01340 [Acetobacter pasteurianus]|uniref:Uncharacterized protein n=4 Tax=Acetobacter pasteurianus TaxID=438 RepID=A0A401WQS4_ACEPA|nr:hypothetical protein [Acetobacter pasteurianus]BAU37513.1 hypothetical protein APT_00431 [Acetobacter pasteurianus NBRC 101655]ASC05050.1 hypothetical protein S101468_00783 [Acetobacter pasteurianus subsp. pasteurianus]QHM91093.1 hypothetical protein FCN51_05730 [Acetobacter pasteurianus]CCT60015.1 hypothetical protein APA386B_1953 [Acetobacter pasteurianus 386B]BAH98621.1 hypothetical protein APA01_04700 [Acetobacter pasteurianus IFO 3283-01]